MNIFALTALINTIFITILGIFVFIKNKTSKINRIYALFCFFCAFWTVNYFLWLISKNAKMALFFSRGLMAGAIFIPVSFLHFVLILLDLVEQKKNILKVGYYIFSLFFILDFTPYFIKGVTPKLFFPFWLEPGIAFFPFLVIWIWYCIYPCYLLYKAYYQASGMKRNQLKYVFLGIITGYIGGSTNYFLCYNIPIPPYGNFFVPLFVGIMAYAIVKYHLMEIKLAITRAGIFLIVYTLVLGMPFWIGYHIRNDIKLWFMPISIMFLLATPGPLIYRYFQKKAEDLLLAKQKFYQKALLEAGKGIVKEHNLDNLLRFITDIIKHTVHIEFVGIFLKDKDGENYSVKKIRGYKNFPKNFVFSKNHSLIKIIQKRKKSLIYSDIEPILNKVLNKPIHSIVPLFMDNNLLGFLVLGEKIDRTFYTEDDINVFEILSRQAVLAIDHCIFMEEFSKKQEKVFQAEKLASIGGMADGIAHQMKNRLNFFSVASGEIKSETSSFVEEHAELVEKNPDLKIYFNYISEIGGSVINNVRKANGIIEGILTFARTEEKGAFFSHFSLNEIIDTSLGLLLVKHRIGSGFPLEVELNSSDLIYGVKSQLLECIYNILDNCYEAIKEKMEFHLTEEERKIFTPCIKLKLIQRVKSVHMEISDNGIGVKEEDKHKIFAPFFTTKPSAKSGTGIGLYIVKRIIEENHKGRISFKSDYMKGIKFFIEIPKKENTTKKVNSKEIITNANVKVSQKM